MHGHGASILVAAIASAFGVGLLQITGLLSAVVAADDVAGESGTVAFMLQLLAFVFIVIAAYVGAVVTSNTFATIVAGRVRSIALLRLLGSTASAQRNTIAREGLAVGVIGSLTGAVAGTAIAVALDRTAVATGFLPDVGFSYARPVLAVPIVGVLLTTWLASWIGCRRVLTVTPLQALSNATELRHEEVTGRRGRNAAAVTLVVIGGVLLAGALLLGLLTPLAVLVGLFGGIISFTGVVLAADAVIPPVLRLMGRLLGSRPAASLAAGNALRYPQRSARSTVGLVIGVTLVTTFGVAVASFEQMTRAAMEAEPELYQGISEVLAMVVGVVSLLIGFSALIAAVGLVNTLSLSVLQRTRELGLLRALGFSARQIRAMILAESAQLVAAALVIGLLLGGVYGWIGAQSMMGSVNGSPGIVMPGVPWIVIAAVVLASAVLTVVASWAPSRRATRVSPIEALAAD
ncbi:ABC transporter permease [Ruicaihuangia caeni]|uniref:FtsX-like permease family protein n=1 Tax=Ruicaihuangia caeni TaxID=3042517 RepID=A0AAW6T901_9MICO|nr:FtsX-like permease family protein [Klugiella sp. YN-L-19]MDI2098530.1 FtsX-like permease family protein [Klugiella sp. YN-L-19]